MADQEEKIPTIAEDIVVTKYKMAAEIVNREYQTDKKHTFITKVLMHELWNMPTGVLKETVASLKVGASVRETCMTADKKIEEETGKAFKKDKNIQKGMQTIIQRCAPFSFQYWFLVSGIAFPCCVSVNNCICHYSPLNSEPDTVLQEGDVVKIDMGAHIDGFIAVVAHTVVVSDAKSKVTGRKADAMIAAHLCAEAALRLVKPGNEVRKHI